MNKKGLFITFEGMDGSGKSTQIELLKKWLDKREINAIITREPGGTTISEKIREIILDKNNTEMSFMTETLLYAASRAQLVDQIIRPALNEGKTVISDRFVDSSIVYQGYGRKLGDSVEIINSFAARDCIPDATFFLKLDPEESIRRVSAKIPDRIESEKLAYHRTVYESYIKLQKKFSQRIKTIEADRPIEDIHLEITERINELLK